MAKAVVDLLVRALEGKLRMVEAGVDKFAGQFFAHPDPRSDEVGVEPAWRSVAGEVNNVTPRRRFSAGKMHMQRAKRGGLAEHLLPGFAIKLIAGTLKRHRIGAIKTAERTAMGELDQKPDRRSGRGRGMSGHVSSTLLDLRSASIARTSFSITAGGAVQGAARSPTI